MPRYPSDNVPHHQCEVPAWFAHRPPNQPCFVGTRDGMVYIGKLLPTGFYNLVVMIARILGDPLLCSRSQTRNRDLNIAIPFEFSGKWDDGSDTILQRSWGLSCFNRRITKPGQQQPVQITEPLLHAVLRQDDHIVWRSEPLHPIDMDMLLNRTLQQLGHSCATVGCMGRDCLLFCRLFRHTCCFL